MKTRLIIALVLLTVTVAAGILSANAVRDLSARYIAAAEELRTLAESGEWPRAREAAEAYLNRWEKVSPWLHILLNHEDADGVALSLTRYRMAAEARDTAMCRDACAELREYARQVYQRDAFTLANVL